MAVIKRLSSKSKVGNILRYVKNVEKTNGKIISGINCHAETAKEEMSLTKKIYDKTDGRQYYHIIQSFKPGEVEPEKAHEIGKELVESKFETYECVVCTHIDKDHIHNHIIVNSVDKATGKKYYASKQSLRDLKKENDRICKSEGLSIVEKKQNRYFTMSEIKTAEKGMSLKFKLMNDIDTVKEKSRTKEEFIKNMQNKGYSVNWTDTRKYITYTMPEGKKFRDRSLPQEYSKEVMENGFGWVEKEKLKSGEKQREAERNINREFEFFFGDKGSTFERKSQSNDSNRKLYDSKKTDGGMEGAGSIRQKNTFGSNKKLWGNTREAKNRESGTYKQNGERVEEWTGKPTKNTFGNRGKLSETPEGDKGRTKENQGSGKAGHKESIKTHSESINNQYYSSNNPDNNINLDNKHVANSKTKIGTEENLNEKIIETVKKDLGETVTRTNKMQNEITKKRDMGRSL
jgi:hypothetical protein